MKRKLRDLSFGTNMIQEAFDILLQDKEYIDTIRDFFNSLELDFSILDYLSLEDIDITDSFSSIEYILQDKNAFEQAGEITYYSEAIKFLAENDNSLRDSLELASEYGFSIDNLNSELLASLLYADMLREQFSDLENEIEYFFADIVANIEELIDEEESFREDEDEDEVNN